MYTYDDVLRLQRQLGRDIAFAPELAQPIDRLGRMQLLVAACLLFISAGCSSAQNITTNSTGIVGQFNAANNLTALGKLARDPALQNSSFAQAINDATFQGLIFAPTDMAFAALMNNSLNATEKPDALAFLLDYHVVPTNTSSPSIEDYKNRTALGTLLTVANQTFPRMNYTSRLSIVPSDTQYYVGGLAPGALFDANAGIPAGQATIYPINDVLVPPINPDANNTAFPLTVMDFVKSSTGFSILEHLVVNDTEINSLFSDPDSAYTIFAPNNDAFDNFLKAANMTPDALLGLAGTQVITHVLKTHILALPPMTTMVIREGSTNRLPTLSDVAADVVTINKDGNGNVEVQGAGSPVPAKVIRPNVLAGKCVVHVVDQLVLPDADGKP